MYEMSSLFGSLDAMAYDSVKTLNQVTLLESE
jgi:hypothetical protein